MDREFYGAENIRILTEMGGLFIYLCVAAFQHFAIMGLVKCGYFPGEEGRVLFSENIGFGLLRDTDKVIVNPDIPALGVFDIDRRGRIVDDRFQQFAVGAKIRKGMWFSRCYDLALHRLL